MALTPNDLAAISKLLEGQEQRLESKIEKSAEATEKRLESKIEKSAEAVKQAFDAKLNELSGEMGRLFEKTWEIIDENKKELDQRISALEDQAGLTHKN